MKSIDALAALDIWGCEVDVGGVTVTVPPLPAADWFIAILGAEVGPIIPGVLDSTMDRLQVMMALMDGRTSPEELAELSRQVLGEVSGWPWWEADRLIWGAAAHWRYIGGQLGKQGIDLRRISLGEALNVIYVVCTATMTAEERAKFEFELLLPPEGISAEELYDAQAATASAYSLLGPPPIPPSIGAPEVIDSPLD